MKVFFILNLLAGFSHYLFQVVAANRLSATTFSFLSSWMAYLSFAFLGASILQYLSCFMPLKKGHLLLFLGGGAFFAVQVSLLPVFIPFDPGMTGALAGLMACAFGIFAGQAQARLLLNGLAMANLLVGVTKILWVLLAAQSGSDFMVFSQAVVFSFLPAILLLAVLLFKFRSKVESASPTNYPAGAAIASTIILGAASTLIPQFELILMEATQSQPVFQQFARLSLFYKGIFFVFLIFSQWLLPHQLRQASGEPKRSSLADWRLFLAALMLSAGAAVLAPYIAEWFLRWTEIPDRWLVLLSCLNMALLTWLFLLVQEFCATNRWRRAALVCLSIFLSVPAQSLLRGTIPQYFVITVIWNAAIILVLIRPAHRASSPTSLGEGYRSPS